MNVYPGELWRDWDRLNNAYNDAHPMMDSRFVSRLVEHFPAPIDVVAARQGGEPVFLLLVESGGRIVTSLYGPSQTQLALALMPRRATIPFTGIFNALPLSVIRLDMYALDPLYHAALVAQKEGQLESGALNMVIDTRGGFDQYWSARPKNLRKNISRYSNRIGRAFGEYQFRVVSAPSDMHAAVGRYAAVESSGWKGKAGTALEPGNTQEVFYSGVMQAFAADAQAWVFELYLGEALAASRLCIANREQLIILKTTYDEQYSDYAAGRILLYETLRYVFEQRISARVDFYTNATRDQLEWATDSRTMYNLSMYRPSARPLRKPMQLAKKLSPV
jgi:CelD/BcsL family acetyltransferase involved in cellulose biosynthesis